MLRTLFLSASIASSVVLVGCTEALQLTMATGKTTWDASVNSFSMPSFLGKDDNESKSERDEEETTQFVGSRVTVTGGSTPLIEGVGLVTRLDGTGGDVPPSSYRRTMLDDMRKRRVPKPEKLLQSPSTALVIVRAYLPPLAQKDQTLDVHVLLPDGSEATSLRGGWLLPCMLYEQGFVAGRGRLRDDEAAVATGPILLSPTTDDDFKNAGVVRKGTIPGGGRYIGDSRTLSLNLRSEFRSARNAKRIADYVGRRFHGFDEYGLRKPLAEAKTDTRIELKVPKAYRDNFPRFLKTVRRVAVSETPIETRIRIERLREDLLDPQESEDAAIQLEAIGKDAIVPLREAISADQLICRFHAATALAYLGDDSGVEVLREAAEQDRALRVWAFLAMSALDGGQAIPELVKLLEAESIETRYGAVRALTTVDPAHPAIRGSEITDKCMLRLVDSAADPLVHLTKSQKSEITIFGADQEFQLPLAARAGTRILVVGDAGDRMVRISRFAPGETDQKRTVSPRVADVLTAAAELGASYPDLVGLLLEAEKQHNLAGRIAIDALPEGGRLYTGSAFSTAIGPDSDSRSSQPPAIEASESLEEPESEPAAEELASPESAAEPMVEDAVVDAVNVSNAVHVGFSPMIEQSRPNTDESPQRDMIEPAESAVPAAGLPPAQEEPALVR